MGRPSSFTQEIADEICERISQAESLVRICQDERMPHVSTVFRWSHANQEFRDNLARAREAMADYISYEIKEIADNTQIGEIVTEKPDGREVKRADMIEHRKLRIDTRIKLMQMLKPKSYATKQPGESPESPFHVKIDREEAIGKLIGNRADPPAAES